MKKAKRILKVLLAVVLFITLSYPIALIVAASWIFGFIPCFIVMYANSGDFEISQYKAERIIENVLSDTIMKPLFWIEKFLKED